MRLLVSGQFRRTPCTPERRRRRSVRLLEEPPHLTRILESTASCDFVPGQVGIAEQVVRELRFDASGEGFVETPVPRRKTCVRCCWLAGQPGQMAEARTLLGMETRNSCTQSAAYHQQLPTICHPGLMPEEPLFVVDPKALPDESIHPFLNLVKYTAAEDRLDSDPRGSHVLGTDVEAFPRPRLCKLFFVETPPAPNDRNSTAGECERCRRKLARARPPFPRQI